MTEAITIMRCALCKKPFSYIPAATDLCEPGARNQICTPCAERAGVEAEREEAMSAAHYSEEPEGPA